MTTCAIEAAASSGGAVRTALTVASDGSYAARLVPGGGDGCWYPERWTLGGPEPYAVPLPVHQPEDADCEVLPLSDGRVLVGRRAGDRCVLALLYPSGAGTGEIALGGVECEEFSLVPQAADDSRVYGLARGGTSTELWLVHDPRCADPLSPGGSPSGGPQLITRLPGRCSGGVRLDRTGDLLAVDRELDGRTKTVVVDLRRGGLVSPLLQLTEESDDRLLMADPDSGLLIIRSDAPGQDRLGWGVLGSSLPVRFPECLRTPDASVTPFAMQPGQALLPEQCAVALRIEGVGDSWVGVWRPCDRRLRQFAAPDGWLVGSGLWTRDGELHLPYATAEVPCGLARTTTPALPVVTQPRTPEPARVPDSPSGPDAQAGAPVSGPAASGPPASLPPSSGPAVSVPPRAAEEGPMGTGPVPVSARRPGSGPRPELAAGPASGSVTGSAPMTGPASVPLSGPVPVSGRATRDPSGPGTDREDGPDTGPVPLQKAPFPDRRAS